MVFFWFRNGLLIVCSLTREERRKRNVGGIVCGDFGVLSFKISKRIWRHVFFREDVNTGSNVINVRLGV